MVKAVFQNFDDFRRLHPALFGRVAGKNGFAVLQCGKHGFLIAAVCLQLVLLVGANVRVNFSRVGNRP